MMNQIEIYQTKDKQTEIEVRFEEDSVWLSQQQMAELFGQTKQNISLHLNNCYKEKEIVKGNCQGILDSSKGREQIGFLKKINAGLKERVN